MKNCKHHILANSTLSWWVGFLEENKKFKIIAPKNFSHSVKNPNKFKMVLDEWIIIKNK